ncbi:MAG: hypothetical protein UV95_C0002G0036 [Candidatus Falkowbacteria bacterium GW2011_GWF2_43_32]|nr:MAG: hypothetical protein UV95_C0002G0036 [Candidatus Falkowbacteria bacterium GW2011_GWF2_43_32]
MDLTFSVKTIWDTNFHGELLFSIPGRKVFINYFLGDGARVELLTTGGSLDITYVINGVKCLIQGEYPDVMQGVGPRAQCVWSFSYRLICSNALAMIAASDNGESVIKSVKQKFTGKIADSAAIILFDIPCKNVNLAKKGGVS